MSKSKTIQEFEKEVDAVLREQGNTANKSNPVSTSLPPLPNANLLEDSEQRNELHLNAGRHGAPSDQELVITYDVLKRLGLDPDGVLDGKIHPERLRQLETERHRRNISRVSA